MSQDAGQIGGMRALLKVQAIERDAAMVNTELANTGLAIKGFGPVGDLDEPEKADAYPAPDGMVYVGASLPGRSSPDVWERRAKRLQERPGMWQQVLGEARATVAKSLERLGHPGRFEVAQRTPKGEEQPKVYARWVADEGSGG